MTPSEPYLEGSSNIMVAVRVRPLTKREMRHSSELAKAIGGNCVVVRDPTPDDDVLRQNRSREKRYAFDHVFDKNATQEKVYQETTSFLVDGLLSGFNATVFAYGATGAGKTFTMLGSETQPGVNVLMMQDIWQRMDSSDDSMEFKVSLSYLEVYASPGLGRGLSEAPRAGGARAGVGWNGGGLPRSPKALGMMLIVGPAVGAQVK